MLGTDPLDSMPILDLRLRKAVRHGGARLVIASERPTALDGGADETARYAPGEAAAMLAALAAELGPGDGGDSPFAADAERLAGELRPGATVVIWGERLGRGADGAGALGSLLAIARSLEAGSPGAGLIEIPDGANGRGLREVGCLPGSGPGFAATDPGPGLDAIRDGLVGGELDAVLLVGVDPIRELPDGAGWRRGLNQARVISHRDVRERVGEARGRRPPRRGARRERGHRHPSGRSSAATAAGGPPPGPGEAAVAGAGRARRAARR